MWPPRRSYSFFDLLQIKKVRDLCARKVRPAVIRQSLDAMQKQVAGMENPLFEAGSFSTGRRIAFRHEGKVVDSRAGVPLRDTSKTDCWRSTTAQPSQLCGPWLWDGIMSSFGLCAVRL